MQLLQRDLKDPRVGFATMTRVETAATSGHARVWVSVYGRRRSGCAHRGARHGHSLAASPARRTAAPAARPAAHHPPRRLDRVRRPRAAHPARHGGRHAPPRTAQEGRSSRGCAPRSGSLRSAMRTPMGTRWVRPSPWPSRRNVSARRGGGERVTRSRTSSRSCPDRAGAHAASIEPDVAVMVDAGDLARTGSVARDHADWLARARWSTSTTTSATPASEPRIWSIRPLRRPARSSRSCSRSWGWRWIPGACDLLAAGLAQDTHTFAHPNATPRTLRVAAELVAAGAPLSAINRTLYVDKPYATLELWGRMLAGIGSAGGRIVHAS